MHGSEYEVWVYVVGKCVYDVDEQGSGSGGGPTACVPADLGVFHGQEADGLGDGRGQAEELLALLRDADDALALRRKYLFIESTIAAAAAAAAATAAALATTSNVVIIRYKYCAGEGWGRVY